MNQDMQADKKRVTANREMVKQWCEEGHVAALQAQFEVWGEDVEKMLTPESWPENFSWQNACMLKAVSGGHAQVVQFLVEDPRAGHKVDFMHANGIALQLASANNHLELVKIIMAQEVGLQCLRNENYRSLANAAAKGHVPIVELLLSHDSSGQAINVTYINACQHGKQEVVEHLLDDAELAKKLEVNAGFGFMLACESGSLALVQNLLERFPCPVDAVLSKGLRTACQYGGLDVVKALLPYKDDDREFWLFQELPAQRVSVKDCLFACIRTNRLEILCLLLQSHAKWHGSLKQDIKEELFIQACEQYPRSQDVLMHLIHELNVPLNALTAPAASLHPQVLALMMQRDLHDQLQANIPVSCASKNRPKI